MEVWKSILVTCMCVIVTTIVCFFMRPKPCTHPDPGPDLVTLEVFEKHKLETDQAFRATRTTFEATAKAMVIISEAIVLYGKRLDKTEADIKALNGGRPQFQSGRLVGK